MTSNVTRAIYVIKYIGKSKITWKRSKRCSMKYEYKFKFWLKYGIFFRLPLWYQGTTVTILLKNVHVLSTNYSYILNTLPFLPATTTCVRSLFSANEYAGPSWSKYPLMLSLAATTANEAVIICRQDVLEKDTLKTEVTSWATDQSLAKQFKF